MTCGECEFFGNYVGMVQAPEWAEAMLPGGQKAYYHPFVGFDEKQGAGCTYDKDAWHKRIRIYDDTPACGQFRPRTWTRPESCDNCDLCHFKDDVGGYHCSGWPYYRKIGPEPCQNGRAYYGKNLRLF